MHAVLPLISLVCVSITPSPQNSHFTELIIIAGSGSSICTSLNDTTSSSAAVRSQLMNWSLSFRIFSGTLWALRTTRTPFLDFRFCRSCGQKRAVELGEWLCGHVLRAVPYRHFVFSVCWTARDSEKGRSYRKNFLFIKPGLKVSSKAGKMIMSATKATITGGTLSLPPSLSGPNEDNMKMEKPNESVIVV